MFRAACVVLLASTIAMAGAAALGPAWTDEDTEFVKSKLWFAAPRPSIMIPLLKDSPVIDGKADEPCWKDATSINTLMSCKGTLVPALKKWGIDPASGSAQIKLFYTADALYAYFLCPEPDMVSLHKTITTRDGGTWQDDCVEFFFDTDLDRRTVYHAIINPVAAIYDAREEGKRGEEVKEDSKWNWDGIEAKADLGKDYWALEVKFPFKGLDLQTPKARTVWGMNFCRQRWSSGPWWSGTWSGVPDTFFGAPHMLGDVVFGDLAVEVIEMPQPFFGVCPAKVRLKNTGTAKHSIDAKVIIDGFQGTETVRPAGSTGAPTPGIHYEAGKASVRLKPGAEETLDLSYTVNSEGLQFASLVLKEGETTVLVERRGARIVRVLDEVEKALATGRTILQKVQGKKIQESIEAHVTKLEELKKRTTDFRAQAIASKLSPEKETDWLRLYQEARAAGTLAAYVIWTKSPWLPARADDFPDALQDMASLDVKAAINETEPAVISITNLTEDYLDLTICGAPPGLREIRAQLLTPGAEIVKMNPHSYGFDDDRGFMLPRDTGEPLVKLSTPAELIIAPFTSRQLWLTFHTAGMKAGQYGGNLVFETLNKPIQDKTIPVKLTVWDFEIPDKPALGVHCFDYSQSTEPHMQDLIAHKVTHFFGPDNPGLSLVGDKLVVDTKGSKEYAEYRLKHGLKRGWAYGLCAHFYQWAEKQGIKLGTPKFAEYWKQTVQAVAQMHKDLGLDYADYSVGVWDEFTGSNVDIVVQMLKMAKEVEPKMRFASTICLSRAEKEKVKDLIDIWVQNGGALWGETEFYAERKKAGNEIWVYTCHVPVRGEAPLGYFRCAGWRAAKYDLDGICFFAWSYLVYQKDGQILPNRAWEAWREGVEDWQYLHEAKSEIARLRAKNFDAAKLKAYEDKLAKTIDETLGENLFPPSTQEASDRLYRNREAVANMVVELKKLQ